MVEELTINRNCNPRTELESRQNAAGRLREDAAQGSAVLQTAGKEPLK